jgi:hypothetical protein
MAYEDDYEDDDDAYEDEDYEPRRPSLKHSEVGIASFIMAIIVAIGEVAVIATAAITIARNPRLEQNPDTAMGVLALLILGGVFVSVVGAVLGVVGLCQAKRNKLFAGLGVALNAVIVVGIVGLMCIGLLTHQ